MRLSVFLNQNSNYKTPLHAYKHLLPVNNFIITFSSHRISEKRKSVSPLLSRPGVCRIKHLPTEDVVGFMSSKVLKNKKRPLVEDNHSTLRGDSRASHGDRSGRHDSLNSGSGHDSIISSPRTVGDLSRQKKRPLSLRVSLPSAGGAPKVILHELAAQASAGQLPAGWRRHRET